MTRGRPLNPVLGRELKERLRTRRATVVVTAYLAVLAGLLYVVYSAGSRSPDVFSGPLASQAASLGTTLFESLVVVMLGLVLFIVPGLTADALTGERERQTLVPLQVTLLRPRAIVGGKLLASLAFVTLLVLATLPLLGISFVVGGVTVGQVAKGVVAVIATGVVVACLSLLCSSLARRTQGAMVLAYGMVGVLVVGSGLVYGAQRVLDDEGAHPSPMVLVLNPFFGVADAVGQPEGDGVGGGAPLRGLRSFVRRLEDERRSFASFDDGQAFGFGEATATTVSVGGSGDVVVGGDGAPAFGPPSEPGGRGATGVERVPFWVRSAVVLGVLAAAAFLVAARRVRTPSDRAAA